MTDLYERVGWVRRSRNPTKRGDIENAVGLRSFLANPTYILGKIRAITAPLNRPYLALFLSRVSLADFLMLAWPYGDANIFYPGISRQTLLPVLSPYQGRRTPVLLIFLEYMRLRYDYSTLLS